VSVFGGDAGDKLGKDMEAFQLWSQIVPESRILFGNKKDNFWEMGDTGPCGPCSEIHIDLRSDAERQQVEGYTLVNNDHPQVIEIWNLVFMQFNRLADGSLKELPAKHVDTGMGFERLVRAIQAKSSNYDSDIFTPFIQFIEKKSGKQYGLDEKVDIAMRVIVDHIRAISFSIADGQLPSNNKAGYVIRRILRRAVRYGILSWVSTSRLCTSCCRYLPRLLGRYFPNWRPSRILWPRSSWRRSSPSCVRLTMGSANWTKSRKKLHQSGKSVVDGKIAFELYDTYGFPLDLTSLIARENGFSVDEKGFAAEMEIQKNRSRAAAEQETGDWVIINAEEGVEFIGYDYLESQSRIVKYRQIKDKKGDRFQIVLDRTPFYARKRRTGR
jgi:alanyl-tRNA synthetase